MRPFAALLLALALTGCGTATITTIATAGRETSAADINDHSVVAGSGANAAGFLRPYVWRAGTITEIPTGTPSSVDAAYALNGAGDVVGRIGTDRSPMHAFLWRGGIVTDLDAGTDNDSVAHDINEANMIAGEWRTRTMPGRQAAIWVNGVRRELRTIGGNTSYGLGISKHGHVVGSSTIDAASRTTHAVVWWRDEVRDLGTLGGDQGAAEAITLGRFPDAGDEHTFIVGRSRNAAGDEHAFVWNRGRMRDLGTLPGDVTSGALDINGAGIIVGYSLNREGRQTAVMWSGSLPIDLNTLLPADSGWRLETAKAINNRREIVGDGTFRGQRRAYLLALPR